MKDVYAIQYWNGTFNIYKTKKVAEKVLSKCFYDKDDDDYYRSKKDYEENSSTGSNYAKIIKCVVKD